MPSRGEKGSSQIANPPQTASGTPPLHTQSSNDHNFYLQCVMEIQRSIGKLETSVSALSSTGEKHEIKLDKINEDVHTAKGMVKAFGWVLSIAGAIGLVLLGSILTVLVNRVK